MSDKAKYAVFTTGKLIKGFEHDAVSAAFCDLFKVTPDKAEVFLGTRKVVKKQLSLEQAKVYQQSLEKIGIGTELEQTKDGKTRKVAAATKRAAPPGLSLAPVDGAGTDEDGTAAKKAGFSCPKCELEQAKSKQCTGCGIYFAKYDTTPLESVDVKASSSAKMPANAKGLAKNAEAASSRQKSRTTDSADSDASTDISDTPFSISTCWAPFVAALVGALIWKLVATVFSMEWNLVAIAIGAGIGFVANANGARGDHFGVLCAVLLVFSIFAGKFWFYSDILGDYKDTVNEYVDTELAVYGSDLRQRYSELQLGADAFYQIDYSDSEYRQFMMDYGYTDSDSADSISIEEIDDFAYTIQPELEAFYATQPSFDEWKKRRADYLNGARVDLSVTSLVMDDLGLFDILFLIGGILAAFKIGRGERLSELFN